MEGGVRVRISGRREVGVRVAFQFGERGELILPFGRGKESELYGNGEEGVRVAFRLGERGELI